jgi:hypothetical protein
MQNVHVVSRPKFHVFSNGALVFGVSLILAYREMDSTIYGRRACVNLRFQHIGLNLQENQVHHSKESKIMI